MSDQRAPLSWAERAAERSPVVQRSRQRSVENARVIVDAALRLIASKGDQFTIQELVSEADVALQTFYRYFPGKDELLLAVLEDLIAGATVVFEERAAELTDPVDRLRSHVAAVFDTLEVDGGASSGRFVASEHWRLARLFPQEIVQATAPFADLLEVEILAGTQAGTFHSADPHADAWLMCQLVMSAYHHQLCVAEPAPDMADEIWRFCAGGLGCTPSKQPLGGK